MILVADGLVYLGFTVFSSDGKVQLTDRAAQRPCGDQMVASLTCLSNSTRILKLS